MRSKKKKIIIYISILILVLIFIIVPFGISMMIYQGNFGSRYETISWMSRSIDEFKALKAQKYTFESNNGQMLIGYTYYKEAVEPKGIVIIAHGLGGGGHNSYMDVADYLATNGYVVFAYDATGNDESEGDSVQGIPQGVIDLDYAIRFVKSNEEFNALPIMLFGHSWGAYSVGSVINLHTDIKAVVMIAGFNQSMDIIEEEGQRIVGDAMGLFVPYLSVIERMMFGSYSTYNCVNGLENSDAGAVIIHSDDDPMVSFENQYQRFYEKFNNNSRFNFIQYNDRGHDFVYYSDTCRQYKDNLNEAFMEFVNSLETELTSEIKTDYMDAYLDKAQLFDLDTELMDQIVIFYNSYAK